MYLLKTVPFLLGAGLSCIASPIVIPDTTLAVDSNTALNYVLNLVRGSRHYYQLLQP